jgi:hypothetical protein
VRIPEPLLLLGPSPVSIGTPTAPKRRSCGNAAMRHLRARSVWSCLVLSDEMIVDECTKSLLP